jgi:hypothetical protein
MSLTDVVKKIADAPRRIKEGAEETGEKMVKKYHEAREIPAAKASLARQKEREIENEQKYKSGKISRELYEERSQRYIEEAKESGKPIEKRVIGGAKTFAIGAKDVATRFEADYRAPPGGHGNRGGRGVRAVSQRKPESRGSRGYGQIDFSRGSAVDFGGMGTGMGRVDFSQPLFGNGQPAKRQNPKRRR